jgi:hypothetical protein
MQPKLLNTVGQSLIAIGLYTVAFESLVLTVKAQMQGHLQKRDPAALKKFYGSLGTSNSTLKFCEPRLVAEGVVDSAEMSSLVAIRRRRNQMAHEGYNETFDLTIEDVAEDIRAMFFIARKVENWRQAAAATSSTGSTPFTIAPSIFLLYLQAAQQLARTTLAIPPDDSGA